MQLYNDEALKVLQGLPSASIDMILTDPPYSSGGQFRGDRMASTHTKYTQTDVDTVLPEYGGDNRDQRAYGYWCALWLSECLRIAKPGAVIALFTDWRQLPTTTDALQAGGWIWRGLACWDKTKAARPAKGRYRNQCEYIVWGSSGPMGTPAEDAPCLPGVFRYVVRQDDKFHPAGKPTPLIVDLLRICRPSDVVLDPFMGSGTTAVAALQLGLEFIGIEQSPIHYTTATQRVAQQQTGGVVQALIPRVARIDEAPTAKQTLLFQGVAS